MRQQFDQALHQQKIVRAAHYSAALDTTNSDIFIDIHD
jgi:hypothetical protein